MKEENTPLVSVVVVAYNSSETITETLESIKNQTYKNIELIITDDASSDDTVEICNNWLRKNGNRFIDAQIVSVEENTGVSGNINRGVTKSKGKWIKSIAGDDLLVPSAIEDYVNFVMTHDENVKMCVSDVNLFSKTDEIPDELFAVYDFYFKNESKPYEEQRNDVMTSMFFVGPTYFYSRELFEEIGGFTEKYGNAEEWPFVYNVIMSGYRIFAINKKLVLYRYSSKSLCHYHSKHELKKNSVFMGTYHFFFDRVFNDLIHEGKYLIAWDKAIYYWNKRLGYRVDNRILKKLFTFFFIIINPLTYINYVKSKTK